MSQLTRKNPFTVWLLIGLTLGVYGLVMYVRLNRELATALALPVMPYGPALALRPAWSKWWSQLIPVYGIVGLHRTAHLLNGYAERKVVSPTATWLFWSWFFVGSYAYLQHGANKVHD